MTYKRAGKMQLLLAILLLLCSCSPVPFAESSHAQSANASSDGIADPASDTCKDEPLLEEENFSMKGQRVVEDFLIQNKTPYRLGLFDLNEDGIPEVMVQNYIGWASECILYDLTNPDPTENRICLNWPAVSVDAVYVQRSEAGVKWRIEGNDSHGFTHRTRNAIFEIENGEVKTVDCALTYVLGNDEEPCSLSIRTVINDEEMESDDFSLEDIPVCERDELLAGSLYQSYMQQDWEKLDSLPWVLEETTTGGSDQLQTRLCQLYREWLSGR